jgi:peptidoglycan/LPS O-acetylase OafA/YrhL
MAPRPLHLEYRADIDGIRAIAVLSVLVFHVHEGWLPGGFTGVDIFFVISGFLITSILLKDLRRGSFSFLAFYRRRILRIAPAYFAVVLVSLCAGALLFLPEDIESLARSALWSSFSLPNVYFWKYLDTSYFAPDSSQVPLLHLWSLGIEEQFYLFWPALLLLTHRLGKRWLPLAAMMILALASFYFAERWAEKHVMFAYYMLPARGGELLVGAMLAALPASKTGAGPRGVLPGLNGLLGLGGVLLICYGLLALNDKSRFPGVNALVPSIGTALLILAGRDRSCWISRLLSFKPLVWVGLISYSLYLWHWPLLAFARYFVTELNLLESLCLVVVIFLVSTASYRWIELPFRRPRGAQAGSSPRVLAGYAAATIVLCTLSFLLVRSDGLDGLLGRGYYRDSLARLLKRTEPALRYEYNCQSSNFYPELFSAERCVIRPQGSRDPVKMILLGDSNAAHYIGVLGAIGRRYGFSFRNVSLSSCPPILGDSDKYGNRTDRAPCADYRSTIMDEVEPYQYVVLGAQWSSHSRVKSFRKDLEKTIRQLRARGKQVVLLGMVPRFNSYGLKCEARRLRLPLVDCERRSGESPYLDTAINTYLRGLAANDTGISYLDVSKILCVGGVCRPYLDSKPVYYDAGHLSMAGSWEIGAKMVDDPDTIPDVFRRF